MSRTRSRRLRPLRTRSRSKNSSTPRGRSRNIFTAGDSCCSRRSIFRTCAPTSALYCAFRAKNTAIKRRALTQEEIRREVEALVDQGHKRLLLLTGESNPASGFRYLLDSIETVYSVKRGRGEIRRVNVEVAPATVEEFRLLKAAKIGTYICFQETYHRATYAAVHLGGKKTRLRLAGRRVRPGHGGRASTTSASACCIGLYDWKFELLAMFQHIRAPRSKVRGRAAHDQRSAAWNRRPDRTWPEIRPMR